MGRRKQASQRRCRKPNAERRGRKGARVKQRKRVSVKRGRLTGRQRGLSQRIAGLRGELATLEWWKSKSPSGHVFVCNLELLQIQGTMSRLMLERERSLGNN